MSTQSPPSTDFINPISKSDQDTTNSAHCSSSDKYSIKITDNAVKVSIKKFV